MFSTTQWHVTIKTIVQEYACPPRLNSLKFLILHAEKSEACNAVKLYRRSLAARTYDIYTCTCNYANHNIFEESIVLLTYLCSILGSSSLHLSHHVQCFYVAGERLRRVLLSDSSVTDAGLILLTQHSSQLQCLDISHCDQLSGGAIRSVAEVS